MVIPPLVFGIVALSSDMSPGATLAAIADQYASPRQNLLVCGLLGLFPFALMALALWIRRRFGADRSLGPRLVAGGAIPIVAVLLWANAEFWTDFLPSRVYPGFPHGLELVLGPGLYAPVAMLAGIFLAHVFPRSKT